MAVNVSGMFLGAREAARRMGDGGSIVNLASITGFAARSGLTAYSTSKHAVVGLTRNLARDLAPRGIPGQRRGSRPHRHPRSALRLGGRDPLGGGAGLPADG